MSDGLINTCWTDGRNQEHGSLERKTDRIWLLSASGSFASRRDSIRANGLSRAAAPCWIVFGRRCQLGARAVGEAKVRRRALGLSDHVGVGLAGRGSLVRRRVRGVRRDARARSMFRGCTAVCAILRSSVSITRAVAFVSNGGVRSPASVAAVGGVAIAPLRGWSDTP